MVANDRRGFGRFHARLHRRLPVDAPLWSAVVVTGRADGATSLVLVLHHVLADRPGEGTRQPDEAERRWIEPALLALLGVGQPPGSGEALFSAWRTFFGTSYE